VSGFSAQWLALREPFDTAARSASLAASLRARVRRDGDAAPLTILDLGCGAGSNLRYLAPLLGGTQRWRLADHDQQLLDAALATTTAWARAHGATAQHSGSTLRVRGDGFECDVECARVDLADIARVELPAGGLVTAAALLDLVSRDWLATLARRTRAAGAAICFALTYDGRTATDPREPDDAAVLALFNRHQLFDKGFGPALGMRAAAVAEAAFEAHGYEVGVATSDWQIGRGDRALQLALLDGWLAAALEIAPESRVALTSWHERRRAHVLAGRSSFSVGHVDLVGWL
jgi:hypothetical protein